MEEDGERRSRAQGWLEGGRSAAVVGVKIGKEINKLSEREF